MAGAVLRHLDRDERTRVVLALHNCHIRRTEVVHEGAAGLFPMGFHLAAALGPGYVAIAATSDGGRTAAVVADPGRPQGFRVVAHPQGPLPAGSIESAFPGGSPLAVVDLRAARRVVGDAGDFRRMRMEDYTVELPVFESYDAVAHIPGTHPTERAEQLPATEHDRGAPTG
jgi:erythromycin esterase